MLTGKCPLIKVEDFNRLHIEKFWGYRVSEPKMENMKILHKYLLQMSATNVAQFFNDDGEQSSVFGFQKFKVLERAAWSRALLDCSEEIGKLSGVTHIQNPKARIYDIFQYCGIESQRCTKGKWNKFSAKAQQQEVEYTWYPPPLAVTLTVKLPCPANEVKDGRVWLKKAAYKEAIATVAGTTSSKVEAALVLTHKEGRVCHVTLETVIRTKATRANAIQAKLVKAEIDSGLKSEDLQKATEISAPVIQGGQDVNISKTMRLERIQDIVQDTSRKKMDAIAWHFSETKFEKQKLRALRGGGHKKDDSDSGGAESAAGATDDPSEGLSLLCPVRCPFFPSNAPMPILPPLSSPTTVKRGWQDVDEGDTSEDKDIQPGGGRKKAHTSKLGSDTEDNVEMSQAEEEINSQQIYAIDPQHENSSQDMNETFRSSESQPDPTDVMMSVMEGVAGGEGRGMNEKMTLFPF